jgi:hypothetical protein
MGTSAAERAMGTAGLSDDRESAEAVFKGGEADDR